MKVYFGQIYIRVGVEFGFSIDFQGFLSEQISRLVVPSFEFSQQYGDDYKLKYNISAKRDISENEVRGPTVFKKSKDVEYTIFLPFDAINKTGDVARSALQHLFLGIEQVLEKLSIDSSNVRSAKEGLIASICSNPLMFREASDSY